MMFFPISRPDKVKKKMTFHDYITKWIKTISIFFLFIVIFIGFFFSYVTIEIELATVGEFSVSSPVLNITLNELDGKARIVMPLYVFVFSGIGYWLNQLDQITIPELRPSDQTSPDADVVGRCDINNTGAQFYGKYYPFNQTDTSNFSAPPTCIGIGCEDVEGIGYGSFWENCTEVPCDCHEWGCALMCLKCPVISDEINEN